MRELCRWLPHPAIMCLRETQASLRRGPTPRFFLFLPLQISGYQGVGQFMMVTEGPLIDEAVLNTVSEALAELHERHHGHPPTSAKSLMMGDDLLACVLRDIYTEVEKTMIGLERHGLVREARSAFQAAVRHRFIAAVERLSGRRVLAFITHHHVDPDLEVALFVLEPGA